MSETVEVLLSNRVFLYTYLNRAFAATPDEEFLVVVSDCHTEEQCALLDSETSEGRRMQRALVASGSGFAQLDALQSEFTKLFIGPAKLPAPPWESVYTTGEPLIFQESTLAVREAYRAAGFRAAGYPHEPDDHLATELGFMAALAAETYTAFENQEGDRVRQLLTAQSDFLHQHILTWINLFAAQLVERESSDFYASFATLGVLICRRDFDVLDELRSLMG